MPNSNWELAVAVFRQNGIAASIDEPNSDDLERMETVRAVLARIGVVTWFVAPVRSGDEASEASDLVNRSAWPFDPPRAAENAFLAVLTSPVGGATVVCEAPSLWTEPLIETVENEVVNHWLAAGGMATGTIIGRLRPGADSALIAQVDTPTRQLVLKAGPAAIVANEVAFIHRVADELPEELALFPNQYGFVAHGEVAAVLMEAADPTTLDERLFSDEIRSQPLPNALDTLTPYLELLTAVHRQTKAPGAPGVGTYVYRDRFLAVAATEGFRLAAARALPEASVEDVLQSDWVASDGTRLRGLRPLAGRLARWVDELVPRSNSIVHGDPHLKNMLSTKDGRPVFIDPRTVWDGNRRDDEGRGDPAYDLATMFHSVWPMSAILNSVECGTAAPASDIVWYGDTFGFDAAWPTPASYDQLESKFIDLVAEAGDAPLRLARARLYIGTANALIGWLQYPDVLPTRESWTSTYIACLHFLQRGLEDIEGSAVYATTGHGR